jgi:hypothetical protein
MLTEVNKVYRGQSVIKVLSKFVIKLLESWLKKNVLDYG